MSGFPATGRTGSNSLHVQGDSNADAIDARPLRRLPTAALQRQLRYEDYTVGWICALPLELTAAKGMLDEQHAPPPQEPGDINAYTFGSIAGHNIVVGCLPQSYYGNNNAAMVGAHMSRSFPNIKQRLMVGIGGGVPGPGGQVNTTPDIRLGDVVVGTQIIQYDLGKSTPNGQFDRTSIPVRPPQALATAMSQVQATHNISSSQIPALIKDMIERHPSLSHFRHPEAQDVLFSHTYDHVPSAVTCDACDSEQLLQRPPRPSDGIVIHYGKIASGNRVIKDGTEREKLNRELGVVLCFEMEAAGLMDHFQCLVIRGICDYADSHKNKQWQDYAAATAAAYAKELLQTIPVEKRETFDTPSNSSLDLSGTHQSIPDRNAVLKHRQRLLESLPFVEIESRSSSIKPAFSQTCKWFLTDPDYLDWLNPSKFAQHRGFLWISGKPGAGKSTIMKFIHTKCEWKNHSDTAVLSFFFNARGADLEKSTEGMYRSLLHQLFNRFADLTTALDDCKMYYDERHSINWSQDLLQNLFQSCIDIEQFGFRRVVCYIDALDECDEDQTREMVAFFEELCDSAFEKGASVYVCFSSRPFPHIELREGGLRFTLEHRDGHANDVKQYVRNKLRGGKNSKAVEELTTAILEKADGVFMWVVLVVDILNKELQKGRIVDAKRCLQSLPAKLSDLFKDLLRRDDTDREGLLLCIQWVLYAKRPLNCAELYFALQAGLSPESETTLQVWQSDYITEEDMALFILNTSKGLIEFTERAGTAQFIHESVRDFLIKDNGIKDMWPELGQDFEALSHDRLKQCCALYMNVNIVNLLGPLLGPLKASSKQIKPRRAKVDTAFPFLGYATSHLFDHANACAHILSQDEFLRSLDFQRWLKIANVFRQIRRYSIDTTPFYVFCEHGHTELIKIYIGINPALAFTPRNRYRHPVLAAFMNGHAEAYRTLLQSSKVDVEATDEFGKPLLSEVIRLRQMDLVRCLMERGANPNVRDKYRATPVSLAVLYCQDNYALLRYLLSKETVDPKVIFGESQDSLILTVIGSAISGGEKDLVEILLHWHIAKVGPIEMGLAEVLMWHALEKWTEQHRLIFRLIMDNIDPRVKVPYSSRILQLVVRQGDGALLDQILDDAELDINERDWDGCSVLHTAVRQGHTAIVQRLLGVAGISVNLRDDSEACPLSHACHLGHDSIVEILLGAEGIDVNNAHSNGTTPLMFATKGGNHSIMKLLLRADSNITNSRNIFNRTALMYAVGDGNMATVQLLLSQQGVDIEATDIEGETAYSYALMFGHQDIAQLLQHALEGRPT